MTDESACLRALREAADRLGESPTKAQYEDLAITPSSSTIRRLFGSWNAAKQAADLETYTQREGRDGSIQPKPDDVDLPDGHEWANLTPQQRWYYQHREHRIERKDERRRSLRRWFWTHKRDHCECTECGAGHPACLDFHHVGDEKTKNISVMVNDGYGKARIRAEMANCVVLCANCHRVEHYGSGGDAEQPPSSTPRQRAWTTRYKRESDGCVRCDEDRPACLDFHHVTDEKRAGVARLASDTQPIEAIRRELERCELLCANCHREEHHDAPQAAD